MKITNLKGGSLSGTLLCDDGKNKFVRKFVSTKNNREYGYVRWYSQLKKMQRFSGTGLFPKILRVGISVNGDAYFDMAYLDGYTDIKTILSNETLTDNQIEKMVQSVWRSLHELHGSGQYNSIHDIGQLYLKEEVQQKLDDALKYEEFQKFYNLGTFEYNGKIVHGIENFMPELQNFFEELNFIGEENIHGNPTLENMMYSFDEDKVMFIDPYEESCIDSRLLDYSQVLQCSRSYYGFINDREVDVDFSNVSFNHSIPNNFVKFNEIFESEIAEARTKQIVDVLEATQFIRMLPFKCAAGEIKKAKYFYVHACELLSRVFK